MTAGTLIIGCGNPLRGDDGLAHELLRIVQESETDWLGDAEIQVAHQLNPEMAESASLAARVIIVDAAVGTIPGAVSVRKLDAENRAFGASSLSHGFGAETLLAAARDLFGASPEAYVVSIGAQQFDHGTELSDAVRQAIPEAVRSLRQLVTSGPGGRIYYA